ncbi:hypothetical protein ACFWPU_00795 [Streptomyces sp. NPDC058471]|uniref:hypothetical protein n=1 Tax=Streptomyces sp. NPDC058471 TaxID=3346516 RepID=UPI0036495400
MAVLVNLTQKARIQALLEALTEERNPGLHVDLVLTLITRQVRAQEWSMYEQGYADAKEGREPLNARVIKDPAQPAD